MRKGWMLAFVLLLSGAAAVVLSVRPARSAHLDGSPPQITFLEQGWNAADREVFYHQAQGAQIFPYEWFMALEQYDSNQESLLKPFASPDNLARFGFIPDPAREDHLPVGFTSFTPKIGFSCDDGEPVRVLPQLGFTCAACHTGQINVTDKKARRLNVIYIDGGASLHNNLEFSKMLALSVYATVQQPAKMSRFARKVLAKPDPAVQEIKALGACVGRFLTSEMLEPREAADGKGTQLFPVEWGFGRFDALARGGNMIFMPLDRDNVRPANAPVSIPKLWSAPLYDWVQWNGSVASAMARNIGQAVGIGARLFKSLEKRRHSWASDHSIDLDQLKTLEYYVEKLSPPSWPDKILGAVNEPKARKGKALYAQWCAHCHVPAAYKNKRYEIAMIPIGEVGTDPTAAFNFYERKVVTGKLGLKTLSAVEATRVVIDSITRAQGVRLESNHWRAPLEYMARPHSGIWATPPFLHNGSVPTLYQLLSPVAERAQRFCLGDLEFDPKDVGYVHGLTDCRVGFIFDTALPGNSNAGHEFRNVEGCEGFVKGGQNGVLGCGFKEEERYAIVEYLKTCDFSFDEKLSWDKDRPPVLYCRPKSEPVSVDTTMPLR